MRDALICEPLRTPVGRFGGVFRDLPAAKLASTRRRLIDRDEHPRADATLERLAALAPVMARSDPDATVTAGNAGGQNDGAAVCIVTHAERAAELGLTPLARLGGGRWPGFHRELWESGPCRRRARHCSAPG